MLRKLTDNIRYRLARMIIRRNTRRADSRKYRAIRRNTETLAAKYMKLPEKCRIEAVSAGGVPAEWTYRDGTGNGRVILYLHGGGYVFCSPRTHRDLAYRIARASGARALSLDYRLAPEHPHPAAIEDALAAYRWLLESGTDPKRVAVMGDSAGGGLTLALLMRLRDLGIPQPACAVCLSPWADLTCSAESYRTNRKKDPLLPVDSMIGFARLYVPEGDLAGPSVSPAFGDYTGLPPVLLHAGTDEILMDDSRLVAEKARRCGADVELKIWPGMIHVFQAMAFMVPEARQAIREIGEFVGRYIP